jgi:protein gp37
MDQITTTLDERERRIEDAERNNYLIRGRELGAIRDDQSWRMRYNDISTFEDYCEQRWELTDRHARHLIGAAAFGDLVGRNNCSVPSRESHIRPLLARLEQDDDRIAVWRDVMASTNGAKIKAADVDHAISRFLALRNKECVTLDEWRDTTSTARAAMLGRVGKKGLNKQDNTDIEWADWSWNPITGCLHGCPYCYARNIAFDIYPADVGFSPTIWLDRLTAPQSQKVPADAGENIARKNIFTCSMADLFGRWVPAEWIERVLAEAAANPQWNFLFLTKFPKRMAEFDIPANAWMGTTVDLQARVSNAEKSFAKVKAGVRWLSIEPMLEPLKFTRLDLFDWIVIGGASPSAAIDGTPATPAWTVPVDWIVDLHQQARSAGCKVYYKTNSGLSGQTRIREYPGHEIRSIEAPEVFDYLHHIAKNEQTG